MRRSLIWCAGLIVSLFVTNFVVAQTGQQRRNVVVNGQSGEIIVYQIDGRSFVDLESLARIANGTLSFRGNQIVLTIPTAPAASGTTASSAGTATSSAPATTGLSSDFMKAGIQTLAATKSWTDTLAYAAQNGVPGNGSGLVVFHNRAAEALGVAKIDASSASDQSALQLLTNHVTAVQNWNDTLVAQRKAMNTGQYSMSANSMANDPAYQKITACSKFLGTMLSSGQFQDDGSCH